GSASGRQDVPPSGPAPTSGRSDGSRPGRCRRILLPARRGWTVRACRRVGKHRGDSALVEPRTIVVLQGDETGQELLEESLRVLQPDLIGFPLRLETYDLSLDN